MVRITVELVPRGNENRKRLLGSLDIINVGGTLARGDYRIRRRGKRGQVVGQEGAVQDYPRLAKSFWHLVERAIQATHPTRS